jgi:hypothetical protein
MVNDQAQELDPSNTKSVKQCMGSLQKCIEVIDQNSNKLNLFPELYYETYNNLARCENFGGNIKASLSYLMMAMDFMEVLSKEQDEGANTYTPELSLNICNAQLYLRDFP